MLFLVVQLLLFAQFSVVGLVYPAPRDYSRGSRGVCDRLRARPLPKSATGWGFICSPCGDPQAIISRRQLQAALHCDDLRPI